MMPVTPEQPDGSQYNAWAKLSAKYAKTGYDGTSMVFGDSRARGITAADWQSAGFNPALMAVAGTTAEEVLWTIKHTDPALTRNVKEVFLSAGGNDMKDKHADPDKVADSVKACIQAIHDLMPNAKVYYIEMFEADVPAMSLRAEDFNKAMDADQAKLNYHYVELPPMNPYDSQVYKADRIHLTSYGNQHFVLPAIQEARALGDHYEYAFPENDPSNHHGGGGGWDWWPWSPVSSHGDAAGETHLGAGELTGVGGHGHDALYGNDLGNHLSGGARGDLLDGGLGGDRLAGGAGGDRLFGSDGRDHLLGGKGADLLVGGAGHDVLSGGHGADTFQFGSLADGGDRIRDFHAAEGDVLDLSLLDANVNRAGDQRFHFADAFTGHAGEAVLHYDAGHDRTILRLDVDGDGHADFNARLDGHVTADAGWVL